MRKGPWLPLALWALCVPAVAQEVAVRPQVDASALAPLGAEWRGVNPYRGQAEAIEIGRITYAQTCARCHGPEANATGYPAPDLRRVDLACRRIVDPAIKAKCIADNDVFFSKSARKGKIIVGVVHMPAWEPVLGQELIWAIRSYVETRPLTPLKPLATR
ncbi:Cytochrome c550 [Rhodovastum atsumiense]|uniref:Cytochrome C n=1 Tax=Rhodovastum atsumiense TaxID=504468 RepID=A0A5M6IJB5_9PROT|nr:c-type cytochrome [Rhodovastum atsumiense]KAA5608242.1 cytochrome C [Rhodovastum atsumiense]CAH2602605.1 Cytochrome c550 [Rhodovastum atsumiense]